MFQLGYGPMLRIWSRILRKDTCCGPHCCKLETWPKRFITWLIYNESQVKTLRSC